MELIVELRRLTEEWYAYASTTGETPYDMGREAGRYDCADELLKLLERFKNDQNKPTEPSA